MNPATASPPAAALRPARWATLYPYVLLGLAQLSWAGNWVIGRAVRDAMPPASLTFWRWTIAALVLAPFALPRLKGKGAVLRRDWHVLLSLGVCGAGFFQAMVYSGLHFTEALNATLMYSASPLFIMLIAWAMTVEPISARQIAGMALSFCGILVIVARGQWNLLEQFHFNPGDFIILAAMPAWGLYCVLLRRRPAELDGIALLFVISTVGGLALAPFYAFESVFMKVPRLGWSTISAIAYVGLFASVFSYTLWNRGVALVGPNRAGFTNHLLPAFTAVLAVALLGERLRLFHLVGIVTILAGVWLATSTRIGTASRPASWR